MKVLVNLILIIILLNSKSFGQTNYPDTFSVSVDTIYAADTSYPSTETIQIEPQFNYKNISWQEYFAENLNSHIIKQNGAPEGTRYNIPVSYLITKKGTITDLRISTPIPDYGMVKEITRFFKNCPPWKPAMQNGRNVIYRMRETIEFFSY